MKATAIGVTFYFGSEDSNQQIIQVSEAFEEAHRIGMQRFCGVMSATIPLKKWNQL